MELSQDRSRAVLEYVLSIPTIRLAKNWNWLVPRLTANGLSGINPIRNPDGSENEVLSQRVEFKIRTKTEARLQEILKALGK
jgi:outer membrane protein OmpA-like peptidoglycan-associated protein